MSISGRITKTIVSEHANAQQKYLDNVLRTLTSSYAYFLLKLLELTTKSNLYFLEEIKSYRLYLKLGISQNQCYRNPLNLMTEIVKKVSKVFSYFLTRSKKTWLKTDFKQATDLLLIGKRIAFLINPISIPKFLSNISI